MANGPTIDGFHLLIPGSIDQQTGGYAYDRNIVASARGLGCAVTVHELAGRFPLADAATVAGAARCLAAIPDGAVVVIDGLALPALPSVLAAAGARLRLVGLVHHPCSLETGLTADMAAGLERDERAALACCRAVVVTSGHTRDMLARLDLAAGNPVHVVRPGVARREVGPLTTRPLPSCGPLRLLCVATVTARKGHDILVRALARLDLDWCPDWQLDCIGALDRDVDAVAALRDLIARLGLTDRVRLLGAQPMDRVGAAYRRADVFVLPSRYEGYGMVFAEAMAHGLPIVAATGGAVPETVPEQAGVLVAVDDVDGLARALAAVIASPERRARLAGGARAAARALPEWRVQGQKFLEFLAAVGVASAATPARRVATR